MTSPLVDLVNTQFKIYEESFVLNPTQMSKFKTKCKLDWKKIEFNKANKPTIPQSRGVYAFVIEFNSSNFPQHGYVMYLGESGYEGNHNLQKRYSDYLKDKHGQKRPRIHYLLNNWETCLYFHYAVVDDKRVNLRKLEQSLNDTLVPPCSKNDFSAEVRKGIQAWR